ncbi:MAG TPA: lipase, partial [Lactobacillus sp.]|nr:lipase [Lactobacillus sp.]
MAKLKNIFIACSVVLVACLLAFGGWQLFGPATSPSEVK